MLVGYGTERNVEVDALERVRCRASRHPAVYMRALLQP